jgi:hypothetical protein
MSALLDAKEREIIRLRRQVAWLQRQIFGQKSGIVQSLLATCRLHGIKSYD